MINVCRVSLPFEPPRRYCLNCLSSRLPLRCRSLVDCLDHWLFEIICRRLKACIKIVYKQLLPKWRFKETNGRISCLECIRSFFAFLSFVPLSFSQFILKKTGLANFFQPGHYCWKRRTLYFLQFQLCYAHLFFSFQNRRFSICISFSFWKKEKPSVLKLKLKVFIKVFINLKIEVCFSLGAIHLRCQQMFTILTA